LLCARDVGILLDDLGDLHLVRTIRRMMPWIASFRQ
jgi:hypothetical protein